VAWAVTDRPGEQGKLKSNSSCRLINALNPTLFAILVYFVPRRTVPCFAVLQGNAILLLSRYSLKQSPGMPCEAQEQSAVHEAGCGRRRIRKPRARRYCWRCSWHCDWLCDWLRDWPCYWLCVAATLRTLFCEFWSLFDRNSRTCNTYRLTQSSKEARRGKEKRTENQPSAWLGILRSPSLPPAGSFFAPPYQPHTSPFPGGMQNSCSRYTFAKESKKEAKWLVRLLGTRGAVQKTDKAESFRFNALGVAEMSEMSVNAAINNAANNIESRQG